VAISPVARPEPHWANIRINSDRSGASAWRAVAGVPRQTALSGRFEPRKRYFSKMPVLKLISRLYIDSTFESSVLCRIFPPRTGGPRRQRGRHMPTRCVSSGFAWFILSVIATAVAVPSPAAADTFPPASLSAVAGVTPGTHAVLTNANGVISASGCFLGLECGTTEATVEYQGGAAEVSVNGYTSGPYGEPVTGADAFVGFSFSVIGSKNELVPIIINANGTAETTGAGKAQYAEADIIVQGENYAIPYTALFAGSNYQGLTLPPSFAGPLKIAGPPGAAFEIEVEALCQASNAVSSCGASVDPMVEIDPSFPDAADFTLEFSPNLPTTPVPQPSSLLLLGTGLLALLGAGMYKRPARETGGAVNP